jgi:hypothetical protein
MEGQTLIFILQLGDFIIFIIFHKMKKKKKKKKTNGFEGLLNSPFLK